MNISTRIIFIFLTILGLLGAVVVSTSLLAASSQQTADAELQRFQSHKLADQLRQSSDDLTRMARTYVVTGDAAYEQYFYEILAIRNGIVPRPKNYDGIYWDFVTATKESPIPPGAPVALIDLMKQVGLTSQELAKLKEAKNNSDQLTNLEKIAFGAIKGLFADDTGKLTIHRDPNPAFARKILHGPQYHKAKAEIMRPIGAFLNLLDQRTLFEVAVNRTDEDRYRKITIMLVVATILFSLFAFFHIRKKIITPILSLSTIAVQIRSGATDKRAVVTSSDEIGTLNNAFNEMTDQTLEMIAGLKHQITERKKAEAALAAAKGEAETANRTKSEFLAAMSHEFRTPLNAILGFADILSGQYFGPISEKYQEYAVDIHSSGEHLLTLVNDILDLSTIEAGKQSLVKEKLSTMEIVTECERIMEEKARSLGIDLITKIPKDLPPLYADRRAAKQILLNLLSNAVKFTPQGGKITVSAKASKKNTTLKIADTGKGIAAEKLPKLTDPFSRGDSDPYRTEQGWGLGLAITKSLVDLHDGTLDIKSKVGKGTTVTVTLPNAP